MTGTWSKVALAVATIALPGLAALQRFDTGPSIVPAEFFTYGLIALSIGWAIAWFQPGSPVEGVRLATLVLAADYLVTLFARARGWIAPEPLRGEAGLLVGLVLALAVGLILMTQQMSWIALKMLTGDKAKFFGIVLGLTFAALLITQQGSIFCGLMRRTAGQVEDISGADLWVMDPNVRYIDDVKPMLETSLYRVRGVAGVEWAVPLYKGNARLKLKTTGRDGKPEDVIEQVILLGLDDASLVGAPPPKRILCGTLDDLRKTDAILIDYNRLKKLFPGEKWDEEPLQNKSALLKQAVTLGFIEVANKVRARRGLPPWSAPENSAEDSLRKRQGEFARRFIGREVEMNDHRGIIVGVCEATRTFQSNPVVYTLYSRAKQFVPRERKLLSYVLAKTAAGLDPKMVAGRIAAQTGLKARTSEDFMWDTMSYYFIYTGIPINFGITTILGFLVGTAIAGQTFYNFTIENLKQFGSLKAMGATNSRIVGMILLQATVSGLLGYGIGVGLATFFGVMSSGGELAFFTWWPVLPVAGVAIVLICILSSILCIRRVIVLEPAVVFRG
jgi:putative ABC transport system permease protein